jgi:hypothetical protein
MDNLLFWLGIGRRRKVLDRSLPSVDLGLFRSSSVFSLPC